jgi:glycine/D-amino acid oxidase-like deaminating enzyme
MMQYRNIKTILHTEALQLHHDGKMWRVNDKYQAPIVVIANAKDAISLPPVSHFPLIPMRGQISIFKRTKPLNCIVNYGGYAVPHDDFITLGATYDRRDMNREVSEEDVKKNILEYNDVFVEQLVEKPIGGRVAWRTTTPSKRPIVGSIGQGLYVSLGLASRGALLAPYMAEQIVSEVIGAPQPLQKSVKQVLLKF